MNPPFAAIQWLARDREDEIREEAYRERSVATAFRPERQPRFQEQMALVLRGLADRLDPQFEECDEPCAEAA